VDTNSLDLIRQFIAELLLDSGLFGSAEPYPSAAVGSLPHAQLGFPQGRFELGMSTEVAFHDLPVSVFVAMRGEYGQELLAVESLLPQFVRLIHTNLGLGGLVDRCMVSGYSVGVLRHGGVDHTGFIATLEIKERQNVALGG
jgi:hypothetical protein